MTLLYFTGFLSIHLTCTTALTGHAPLLWDTADLRQEDPTQRDDVYGAGHRIVFLERNGFQAKTMVTHDFGLDFIQMFRISCVFMKK